MKKNYKKVRGFTLVETLVTIMISIIVASLVVGGVTFLTNTVVKANDSCAEEAEIGEVQRLLSIALNNRYLNSNSYQFETKNDSLKVLYNNELVLSYVDGVFTLPKNALELTCQYITNLTYRAEEDVLIFDLFTKKKEVRFIYQWRCL